MTAMRWEGPDDVLVLCYHALSDTLRLDTTVAIDRFERNVAALRRRGYTGLTLSEAVIRPRTGRVVAFTFDDAYRSALDVAFPILRGAGFAATIFVPTALPGSGRPADWPGVEVSTDAERQELLCLGWDELGGLADAGWEVGSHTHTHPRLPGLDDAALADELGRSRAECEDRLGRPCTTLSYPYTDVDARVVAATSEAGYAIAVTVPRFAEWPLPLRWPRVGLLASDSDRSFALRTSVMARRAQATALGGRVGDAVLHPKHGPSGR